MSLTSEQRLTQYTLSGAGQTLPTVFRFFDPADIKVTKTVAGVDTVLVLTTDYSITGGAGATGIAATGSVVMVAGVAADIITIEGVEPQTQLTDLTLGGPFPASTLTAMVDRVAILCQQIKNRLDRCISVPNTAAVTPPLTLAQRTSAFPYFNASGVLTTLTLAALLAGGVPVAANQVFAGPTSGGSAIPTYRPLVIADLALALAGNVSIGTVDGSLVGIGSAGVAGNMLTLGGTFYQTGLQINTTPTATGNGQALAALAMNLSFSSSVIGGYTGLAGYGIVVSAGSLSGSGSFTTLTGIQVGNVAGATTNYSIRTFAGIVNFGGVTDATSSVTGDVRCAGGVGIAKKLFVGTDINGSGNLSLTGVTNIGGTDTTGFGNLLVKGATNAVRIVNSAAMTVIEGVDNTGTVAYRALQVGGLTLALTISGVAVVNMDTNGIGVGTAYSSTTRLNLPLGTTGVSSLRIAHGAAPTAPVNGDIWTTTAGLFVRVNGVTVGPLT